MPTPNTIIALNAALLDIAQNNPGAATVKLHTLIQQLLTEPTPPPPEQSVV